MQWGLCTKEEKSSPSISWYDFYSARRIDALEVRDKHMTDAEGTHLYARIKDDTLIQIVGKETIFFLK